MGISKESIGKFLRGSRFPIKSLLIDSVLTAIVESTYLNTDMRKFASPQKHESRTQSADSSKANSKPGALDWQLMLLRIDGHPLSL